MTPRNTVSLIFVFRTTAPLIELVILLYKSCISFTFTKTKYKNVIQKLEISFGFETLRFELYVSLCY